MYIYKENIFKTSLDFSPKSVLLYIYTMHSADTTHSKILVLSSRGKYSEIWLS